MNDRLWILNSFYLSVDLNKLSIKYKILSEVKKSHPIWTKNMDLSQP